MFNLGHELNSAVQGNDLFKCAYCAPALKFLKPSTYFDSSYQTLFQLNVKNIFTKVVLLGKVLEY